MLICVALGSVAAIAATVGTGEFALPLVVLAGASAGVMFGTSDVIEGVGDLASGITGQGLDQRSYNPVRDTVFGGNEFLYAGAEVAVSLGTSAAASKALAAPAVREAEVASSGAKIASAEARADFYVKPNGELVPGTWLIHGEPRCLRVHPGKQGKHILGHNNYRVAISKGKTPSVFYGTAEDAQRLVNEFAGTGQMLDNNISERVNFEKVIGLYVDEKTGESLETTWGTIRYAKDGVHIVPSNPDSYYKK